MNLRRALVGIAVAGLTAVISVFALPASAQAASGLNSYRVTRTADGALLVTTPTNWNLGHCTMYAGATIRIDPPNPVSHLSGVSWMARGSTTTLGGDDVWNLTVNLTSDPGIRIGRTGELHGAHMTVKGRIYPWSVPTAVAIEPSQFSSIAIAGLEVSC